MLSYQVLKNSTARSVCEQVLTSYTHSMVRSHTLHTHTNPNIHSSGCISMDWNTHIPLKQNHHSDQMGGYPISHPERECSHLKTLSRLAPDVYACSFTDTRTHTRAHTHNFVFEFAQRMQRGRQTKTEKQEHNDTNNIGSMHRHKTHTHTEVEKLKAKKI